jgi:NAD(P)-dependent dehydrogenase (short-subunit alcohol dehydrogenase family)
LDKPRVFITGAAAGIGRATALKFASQGYRVGAYDVDEEGLISLQREIAGVGGHATIGRLDVRDAEQWAQCLENFVEPAGRLDILINNAGVLCAGPFQDTDLETHRRVIDINVTGTLSGTLLAFPYLQATPGAQVVNLCSASAMYGQPELASYSTSKFAIRGLTEALNLEWAKHGIRVIAIWPLFVRTGMLTGVNIGSTRSLGVRLTADDVANAVFDATRPKRHLFPRVHYAVGIPAKALSAAIGVSPTWAKRALNKAVSRL